MDRAGQNEARRRPAQKTCRLVPVSQVIHETFVCVECGQQFSSQAALRSNMHMESGQQQQRDDFVKSSRYDSSMEHALEGMPTCKHCRYRFGTWHTFHYHVNSRSCPVLRAIYEGSNPGLALSLLSDNLVYSEVLLELAGSCTWQQLAEHPLVRTRHHHCPECNHWNTSPQYVKRHMLAKHKDQALLIETCVSDIKKSRLSLCNPCQFCGQSFTRGDAHLRSCVGVFFGVYLHKRLARGAPTQIATAGTKPLPRHDTERLPDGRRDDDSHPRVGLTGILGATGGSAVGSPQQAIRPDDSGIPGTAGTIGQSPVQVATTARPKRSTDAGRKGQRGRKASEAPSATIQQFFRPVSGWQGREQSDGAGGTSQHPQHGHDPSPPARGATEHQPHGHRLRDLSTDDPGPELGLPHRQGLEGDGAERAREAQGADEIGTSAALVESGAGEVSGYDVDTVVEVRGPGAQMDLGECGSGLRAAMEHGGSPARKGRLGRDTLSQGGRGGPQGDDRTLHAPFGGAQVPCDPDTGGSVPVAHCDHDVGGGQPLGGIPAGLEASTPVGTVSGMDVGGLLSTSRTTTGQSLGEEIDADHQAVMCLKLGMTATFAT